MATLRQQCVSDVQSLRQDRSQLKTEVQEVIKMINSKLNDDDLLSDLASVTSNMTVTHEKNAEMNEDTPESVHPAIPPCSPAPGNPTHFANIPVLDSAHNVASFIDKINCNANISQSHSQENNAPLPPRINAPV